MRGSRVSAAVAALVIGATCAASHAQTASPDAKVAATAPLLAKLKSDFPDLYTAFLNEVASLQYSGATPNEAFVAGSKIMSAFVGEHLDDLHRAQPQALAKLGDQMLAVLLAAQREDQGLCARLGGGLDVGPSTGLSVSEPLLTAVAQMTLAKLDAIASAKANRVELDPLTEEELALLLSGIPTDALRVYVASGNAAAYAQVSDAQKCRAMVEMWRAIASATPSIKARATAQELIGQRVGESVRASASKPDYWLSLGGGSVVVIDRAAIEIDGAVRRSWLWLYPPAPPGEIIARQHILVENRCGARQSRKLQFVAYDFADNTVTSSHAAEDWAYVAPSTNGETLFKFICADQTQEPSKEWSRAPRFDPNQPRPKP